MFSEHTGVPRTRRYTIDVDSLIDENTVVFSVDKRLLLKPKVDETIRVISSYCYYFIG